MVQGSGIDAPLNETGRQQADAFFKAYGDIPFDKVYVSELKRTHQSVQRFLDKSIPCEIFSGLNEISWGSQEGKAFSTESAYLYEETIKEWNNGNTDVGIGGGESPDDVMARQKPVIDYIISKKDEKRVLICMHGRAMRIMLTWMLGYHLRYQDYFDHQNLGLYELTYTGSRFRIDKYNITSHLNGLSS